MNVSSQKTSFNLNAHGMNCPDPRCVLPICVNVKLQATRHTNSPQRDKQNRHANEDTSRRSVNRQRSGDCKESLPLVQSVLAHNTEEQLLKELKDFERVFQNQKDQFDSSFLESLGITQPNINPLLDHTGREDWNNVGSQQVPHATEYDPILDMEMNNDLQFPANSEPDKSISDPSEDLQPSSYLEQFGPMSPYAVALEKEEDKTAKRTKHDHHDMATEFPPGSNAIKGIVSSLEDSKKQLRGHQFKESNKLFGILSEILRMFECPMSADLEAFYVQTLQKALKEIQNAVPFNM
ncbi:uncharacterized protein LOC144654813 [Oculina patagonica]